ncbi:PQQ-dependent sugar dehydrogenase [Tautonia sociabilis]|uniref:Glucose/Sorbosone dehydrogenase domain-containing protein n=1 Tax=Tautonia sociabilis TaxID=2080755 RepID=A0A432MPA9_9BACT|nr:PQQ-dependent sugar dehydrogenase [Tautonia sociabilis]RUL89160.1 hypothetical protein TsocGM_03325 [Tautonia sociabilis]
MLASLQSGDTSSYANYLLAFSIGFAFLCIASAFLLGKRERWWTIAGALVVLVLGVVIASVAGPGRNSVVNLLAVKRFETVAGGLSGLLAALAVLGGAGGTLGRALGYLLCLGVIGFCTLNMAKDAVSASVKALLGRGSPGRGAAESPGKGPSVELFAELDLTPICMARDAEGRLYVGGVSGDINWMGIVSRLDRKDPEGPVVETRVARDLVRPHGMAFHDGDLFIARTGEATRAVQGRMSYEATGAVTRLTDVDGDGRYDLYIDVLDGLPGAFGVHQTSALVFDQQGWMYVSVGAAEDHSPVIEEYEGTILRCRPDGTELEVFARGARNPYAMALGPGGELFCTDNDADERNRGDVVFHVRQGDHLGFPYTQVVGGPEIDGVVEPLYMPGDGAVLEGLVFAEPGSLPEGYDNCFYVAELFGDSVKRLRVRPSDEEGRYELERVEDVFSVKFPLDLVIAPEEQAMYVLAGYDEKKVYRVTFGEGGAE